MGTNSHPIINIGWRIYIRAAYFGYPIEFNPSNMMSSFIHLVLTSLRESVRIHVELIVWDGAIHQTTQELHTDQDWQNSGGNNLPPQRVPAVALDN